MSRYHYGLFALAALVAAPAAAQQLWQPELGVQAGYSRAKPAGTGQDDASTVISVPSGNYALALFGSSALFAVIPVGNRIAVEPQLTASQIVASLTFARLGARVNYAFTPSLYAAAGGVLNYLSQGPSHTQLGLQVAVGYRHHLTGALNGRLEANWASTHSSDLLPPFNTYSVLAGVSSSLRAAPSGRQSGRATGQFWEPLLGVAGGYTAAHRVGGSSIGGVFFPGSTGDLETIVPAVPAPPTVFAIVPLSGRWAVEPGFDWHSMRQGSNTVTATTAGLRLDYAVSGGWYGGAGGQVSYLDTSNSSGGAVLGATLAWGYRFHLAGALGGRFETSYTMFGKHASLGTPPVNTLGLLMGVLMPLR